MAPHDSDPNKIDVSLNIMSEATLVAINKLSEQLGGFRQFLATQAQQGNPSAQAQSAASWIPQSRPGETQAGIFHGQSGTTEQGASNNPSEGAAASRARADQLKKEYQDYIGALKGGGIPSSELSSGAQEMMSQNISDRERWKVAGMEKKAGYAGSRIDRFFALYPGAQRDPREDRAYEEEAQVPRSGGSALPEPNLPQGISAGASVPPGMSPGPSVSSEAPGWSKALSRDGINADTHLAMTIPRLGEFTIQDKLNMAAQWMGRAAQRSQESGQERTGPMSTQNLGRVAAGAAYLRDQSASMVALQREYQRIHQFARGEELGGEALGFSRASFTGDLAIGGVGWRPGLPGMSEASREGLRQELTQRRVQAAPGISGEEAQAIRQTVAGMGYSGDTNRRLQMDLFRPMQQQGIGPEPFAPMIDQAMRQGNQSVESLKDTILGLGEAARNANMSVEAVASATAEYAESMQDMGGNYEAAQRNALTYVRSGLDPRIVGQAQQNPMVQGIITAQTGVPSMLQGVVGAPGVMQGMGQAIRQGLAMGAGFANQPDRTVTSASGQKITVATGRDQQIALASQTTGIGRQIIERYMDNPDFLEAGGTAQTMVGQMEDQIRAAKRHGGTAQRRAVEPSMMRGALPGNRLKTETIHGLTDAQRKSMERGSTSDSMVQYDELEAQMIAMDPTNKDWVSRVKKTGKKGNIEDRVAKAQKLIGEATKAEPEPDTIVGLTAEARKILKIEKPKERDKALPRANGGGAPANGAMQGPNYPSQSGSAMSYGTPGG